MKFGARPIESIPLTYSKIADILQHVKKRRNATLMPLIAVLGPGTLEAKTKRRIFSKYSALGDVAWLDNFLRNNRLPQRPCVQPASN